MKFIVKHEEPASFTAWKDLVNEDWQPSYDALRNPEKKAVHQALITEQGGICCYCGNSKGDWFDDDLLVSPLDPSCELRFAYTGDGEIHPADTEDDAARMTIQKLCLDIGLLNDRRAKAIEPFLLDDITEPEFLTFVESYLQQSVDGRFNEFHTTIQYLFNR